MPKISKDHVKLAAEIAVHLVLPIAAVVATRMIQKKMLDKAFAAQPDLR